METKKVETASAVVPRARERLVKLEFPVVYDGTTVDHVRVKRVTVGEIEDYAKRAREASERGEAILPPVIDCPIEVWSLLDQDDASAIEDAALDFSPRVLRAFLESKEPEEKSGALSSPSSQMS